MVLAQLTLRESLRDIEACLVGNLSCVFARWLVTACAVPVPPETAGFAALTGGTQAKEKEVLVEPGVAWENIDA